MIYEAIDELAKRSPMCREIFFNLRDGLTVEEICGQLGISRSSLDDRLYRCRKTLRRLLQESCGLRL
jgi:DNA-directed RNA polymerase specialized sigma24 family protein